MDAHCAGAYIGNCACLKAGTVRIVLGAAVERKTI